MVPKYTIPEFVGTVSDTLQRGGFEAYLVGGCVRDIFRGVEPKDWDLTTNAEPEQIQGLFEHTYYENEFGTVGIVNDDFDEENGADIADVEVTTYRLESTYSDSRHPDTVTFSDKVEDDLKRRDFTMNAMALTIPEGKRDAAKGTLVDPFDGKTATEQGVIEAVGDPRERFDEDAHRMIRAVRLSAELDFIVAKATGEAIQNMAQKLDIIAKERVRDDFVRLLNSPNPKRGVELAHDLKLLQYIIPELEEGIGIEQGGTHKDDVWEHLLKSAQAAADKEWSFELRLTALLHDIGKPRTRDTKGKHKKWSFHGHDVVGARMTKKILERLRFPKATVKKVTKLVRWHMFFADTEQITLSAVRRMIRNVGEENIWDLMNLRVADRVGMERPKEQPYRFRKYKAMIEEALRDPISTGQLAIDGSQIMKLIEEKPGPRVGFIMHALLEEVLDDPKLNSVGYMENRAKELAALPPKELETLGRAGMAKKEAADEAEVKELRSKYYVE